MFYTQAKLASKLVTDTAELCEKSDWLKAIQSPERVIGHRVFTLNDFPLEIWGFYAGTAADSIYKVVTDGDAKAHEKWHGQVHRFVDLEKAKAKLAELWAEAEKAVAATKEIADGN